MNHYAKFSGRVVQGSCTAIDRAAAAGCEFYEAGREGWCRHTLKTEKVKGKVRESVTGECYSAKAAAGRK